MGSEAGGAEEHCFGLGGVDDEDLHGVARPREFCDAAGDAAAGGGDGRAGRGIKIETPGGHAASERRQGGTASHRAESDDAESGGDWHKKKNGCGHRCRTNGFSERAGRNRSTDENSKLAPGPGAYSATGTIDPHP